MQYCMNIETDVEKTFPQKYSASFVFCSKGTMKLITGQTNL